MDLRKTQNCPRSVTEGSEDNMKHRKIDKSSPMTPKEALLLERRLKNRQATTIRLLSNKNRIDCSGTTHQIQNDLTIPILSSVSASVVQPESCSPFDALHEEKMCFIHFIFLKKVQHQVLQMNHILQHLSQLHPKVLQRKGK